MNRENSIKRASIFGIAGNLFLLIIKGTVGFITHSQAWTRKGRVYFFVIYKFIYDWYFTKTFI